MSVPVVSQLRMLRPSSQRLFQIWKNKSLEVIPERANVTYVNEKYVEYFTIRVLRYGRKSGYFVNIKGALKYAWSNNVTVHIIFNEFLHNEYRRSFIELHYKFCDLLTKEPYIGGAAANSGVTCPLAVGKHEVMNLTAPTATEHFPNVFPFEKGRLDFVIDLSSTAEPILNFYVVATFKTGGKNKEGKIRIN